MPLLEPPTAARSLATFPSCTPAGASHRVWRYQLPDAPVRESPWWFAAVTGDPYQAGPYDLPEPVGGTCYLASTPVAVLLEVLQDHLAALPLDELRVRRHASLELPEEPPATADATAPGATGFGITAGLWTTPDRQMTQGRAAALRRDGWWALHAGVHHDVTGVERTFALSDQPGEHPPTHPGGWVASPPARLHDDTDLLEALDERGCRPSGPANLPPATR